MSTLISIAGLGCLVAAAYLAGGTTFMLVAAGLALLLLSLAAQGVRVKVSFSVPEGEEGGKRKLTLRKAA